MPFGQHKESEINVFAHVFVSTCRSNLVMAPAVSYFEASSDVAMHVIHLNVCVGEWVGWVGGWVGRSECADADLCVETS